MYKPVTWPRVGNGWAQAQRVMSGAKPILMFIVQSINVSFYIYTFSDKDTLQ